MKREIKLYAMKPTADPARLIVAIKLLIESSGIRMHESHYNLLPENLRELFILDQEDSSRILVPKTKL